MAKIFQLPCANYCKYNTNSWKSLTLIQRETRKWLMGTARKQYFSCKDLAYSYSLRGRIYIN